MASVVSSCKLSGSSSSSPSVTNARDSGASSCSNNVSERVTEDDTLLTSYSPAPVVRSHHQLVQSPYSSHSRRYLNHQNTSYPHSYSHNRHYHLNGDSFDDSSSSLSSTPSSGCTTATATSSTSSTVSDCAIDCMLDSSTMQLEHSNSRPGKNSSSCHSSHATRHKGSTSKNVMSEQALNDLNCSPSSSHSRMSRKSSSGRKSCSQMDRESNGRGGPSGRSSTPPALANTENWSHFHFGGSGGEANSVSCDYDESHRNVSPRASSEVYSMAASLDQRLKSVTLTSSPKTSSSGKAVAVIKGTASVTRLASSSFNNGSLSATSNSSTSNQDWKKHLHSHEIRKLKRELDQSNEKVTTLTSQLATHSHMVTAFEQSLASMSLRLQQLTNLSTQKDCEIARLKSKVEELRSTNRNDTSSLGHGTPKKIKEKRAENKSKNASNTLSTSSASGNKQLSEKERKSLLIRRHTFVSPVTTDLHQREVTQTAKEGKWFRAFRRSSHSSKKNSSSGCASDLETEETSSVTSHGQSFGHGCRVASVESFSQVDSNHDSEALLMHELKKQLREKEKTITDLRLEALTTAHQLQSLEELVSQLKSEIAKYKSENERLSVLSNGSAGSSMASTRLSSQASPSKANEPSLAMPSDWKNTHAASGYASINTLYFNPYDSC